MTMLADLVRDFRSMGEPVAVIAKDPGYVALVATPRPSAARSR
jgi:hypothetical protein